MGIRQFLKQQRANNSLAWRAATRAYSWLSCRAKIRGQGNRKELSGVLARRVRINVRGNNNLVTFGPGCVLTDLTVDVKGSGCRIEVGPNCFLTGSLVCEDNGSSITIGERTSAYGAEIAATEGRAIGIGAGCLFSAEIVVRNGDSHSLLDGATGRRINAARDIAIGSRVWIGRRVTVLKGSRIGDGSVVGACSLVAGEIPPGCAAAGIPARPVRQGIGWKHER